MTPIEEQIRQIERRPKAAGRDQEKRDVISRFCEISRFEGIHPTQIDNQLFDLYCEQRITKQEYLHLCLADAKWPSK